MNPLLAKVDHVRVDFSSEKKLKIGDIVLYRDANKEWLCHRLIKQNQTHLWLKGDANTTTDVVLKGVEYGVVTGAGSGDTTFDITAKFFTPLICLLQRRQITSEITLFKKFYRSLLKVFLYLETF